MNLLIFAGKVMACSGLLWAYYYGLLRNNGFHRFNRCFLLGTLAVSVLLPLLYLPVLTTPAVPSVWSSLKPLSIASWEEAVVLTGRKHSGAWWNWTGLAAGVYIAGCAFAAIPLVRTLVYISRLSVRYPKTCREGVAFYNTTEPGTPFSFGRMLFWNGSIEPDSAEGQPILQHEMGHIRFHHTLDILLAELLAIVFWFNPIFHVIRKELATLHEFLADAHASETFDRFEYAELLVMSARQEPPAAFTNPFFQYQLKRRVAMIIGNTSTRFSLIRKMMIMPVLGLMFVSFTMKLETNSPPFKITGKTTPKPSGGTDTLTVREFVERMTTEMISKKSFSMTMDEKQDWIAAQFDGEAPLIMHYTEFMKLRDLKDKTHTKPLATPKPSGQGNEDAEYPGGPQGWMRYLNGNFHYPEEAQAHEIQGTVVIQFNVDQNGTVSQVEVLDGPVLGGLREEGVRIIQNSGTWIPANKNGKPVASVKIQPIIFRLDSE